MDPSVVIDRLQIADLIQLYCRGLDRADPATLHAIYHDDAVEDRGADIFIGNAHDWVDWAMSLATAFETTQHCVMNMLIEIDGDTATGETYFHAYHRFAGRPSGEGSASGDGGSSVEWPDADSEMILGGRYLDRFERRDGVWKIAYRKMICDWCRTQPVADGWFDANPSAYRGARHPDDARLGTALHPMPG